MGVQPRDGRLPLQWRRRPGRRWLPNLPILLLERLRGWFRWGSRARCQWAADVSVQSIRNNRDEFEALTAAGISTRTLELSS